MKSRSAKNNLSNKFLRVFKLAGAGNDFLVVDARLAEVRVGLRKVFGSSSRSRIAAALCNPHKSIGADGLLFLEKSKSADVKWDFYNADGSRAEMCGNASRVVGLYEQMVSDRDSVSLETRAGKILVSCENRQANIFRVAMPHLNEIETDLRTSRRGEIFTFVNSGVPHAVVALPKLNSIKKLTQRVDNLVEIVDRIRALTKFKKGGTNVTFYAPADGREPKRSRASAIYTLTFERGVNGYTQACGTGVVAAAYAFYIQRPKPTKSIAVTVPGGRMSVDLSKSRPHLIGPAQFIAEIFIYES